MTCEPAPLDHPDVCGRIFFLRPDPGREAPRGSADLSIPVADGVALHARHHPGPPGAPVVLLFHGNGEIVADYDDAAEDYASCGTGLVVVDYRGYGRSSGLPTPSNLVGDAPRVLEFVRSRLAATGGPPLIVMGRSLGSAPAIRLAVAPADGVTGLILESGFARTVPLLRLVGVPVERLGIREEDGFDNADLMRRVRVPTLLLHAADDTIIPLDDARTNHDACGSADKRLVVVPRADHNTIAAYGGERYWGPIREFAAKIAGGAPHSSV